MNRSSSVFLFLFILVGFVVVSLGLAQRPELVYQSQHSALINSVAFSPDGRFIVSGSDDLTIKLWDVQTGLLLRTLIGHTGSVRDVKFTLDGQYILSASDDETIKLWETATGKLVRVFEGHQEKVTSLAVSTDSVHFISGGGNSAGSDSRNRVIEWDIHRGKKVKEFKEHALEITSIALSSDNQYLLSASKDCYINKWNRKNGKLMLHFKADPLEYQAHIYSHFAQSIDWSPDNKFILWGMKTGFFYLWDIEKNITRKSSDSNVSICVVTFSPCGRFFLVATVDGKVVIRKSPSTELLKAFNVLKSTGFLPGGIQSREIRTAIFSPDGQFILTGGDHLRLWEIANLKMVRDFSSKIASVNHVKFRSDNQSLIFTTQDSVVKTANFIRKPFSFSLNGHSGFINSLAYTSESNLALSGGSDGKINLWDLDHRQLIRTLTGQNKRIHSVAFSPDGNYAFSAGDSIQEVWNIKTAELINTTRMRFKRTNYRFFSWNDFKLSYNPSRIVFSPECTFIATDSLEEMKPELQFQKIYGSYNDIIHSYLVFNSRGTVKLWELSTGKMIRLFNEWHSGAIQSMAFSHNGKYVVSGSEDKTIKLWNVAEGNQVRTLKDHSSVVSTIRFSPDDQFILSGSGSGDHTIKLWNVSKGKLLKTFSGHQAGINSVSFSSDGKYFVSASWDNTIKLWNVEKESELATFFFFEDDDWVITTPDGRFEGTPEGLNRLYYVQGLDFIPVNAFFENFYKPGLLADVLSADSIKQTPLVIKFDEQKELPPLVEILSQANGQHFTTNRINLSLKVTNLGGGIDEIRLYQNDKLIHQKHFESHSDTNIIKVVTQEYELTLVPGTNEFQATAFNRERTESTPAQITAELETATDSTDLYILSIGISDYQNPEFNLNYGKPDASEFVSVLQTQSKSIYKNVFTFELFDQNATRLNILKILTDLAEKSQPEDAFVFYFAGHGVLRKPTDLLSSDYFLALHGVTQLSGDHAILAEFGLSATELQEFSRQIKAQKQLYIIDACQAGSVVDLFAQQGSTEKTLLQLARSAGITLLASAGKSQHAVEFSQLGHGVFTYALLEGLSGKADGTSGDGKITVKELEAWLNAEVPRLTQKYQGLAQFPNSFVRAQDFPLGVVK